MLNLEYQFLTLELRVPEESTCSYLTKGKVYKATYYGERTALIVSDIGSILHIMYKDCMHIDANWEILNPHVLEGHLNK
jgi:hypothetical protein